MSTSPGMRVWRIKDRDDVQRLLDALGLDLIVDTDQYLLTIGSGIRVADDEGHLKVVIAGDIWSLGIGTLEG